MEKVLERIFSEAFPGASYAPKEMMRDITPEWGSLGHINLVLVIEEELGIQLTDDEVSRLQTFRDACRIVAAHTAA